MSARNFLNFIIFLSILSGCQLSSFSDILVKPKSLLEAANKKVDSGRISADSLELPLNDIIEDAVVTVDTDGGFRAAVKASVERDPEVLRAKKNMKLIKTIEDS